LLRKAYGESVNVDRALQRKTMALVQRHVKLKYMSPVSESQELDKTTIEKIAEKSGAKSVRVINLVKSIRKDAETNGTDPFLVAMAERAKAVQEKYESRQVEAQAALKALQDEQRRDAARKEEQKKKGMDPPAFFVYRELSDAGAAQAEAAGARVQEAFATHPHWQTSENERRALRVEVALAIHDAIGESGQVTQIVNNLFSRLPKVRER